MEHIQFEIKLIISTDWSNKACGQLDQADSYQLLVELNLNKTTTTRLVCSYGLTTSSANRG